VVMGAHPFFGAKEGKRGKKTQSFECNSLYIIIIVDIVMIKMTVYAALTTLLLGLVVPTSGTLAFVPFTTTIAKAPRPLFRRDAVLVVLSSAAAPLISS
jgi:hypothetical protein